MKRMKEWTNEWKTYSRDYIRLTPNQPTNHTRRKQEQEQGQKQEQEQEQGQRAAFHNDNDWNVIAMNEWMIKAKQSNDDR